MTDRQLADKMAEALEDVSKNYDCDNYAEGGGHDPKRCRCCVAQKALDLYRHTPTPATPCTESSKDQN